MAHINLFQLWYSSNLKIRILWRLCCADVPVMMCFMATSLLFQRWRESNWSDKVGWTYFLTSLRVVPFPSQRAPRWCGLLCCYVMLYDTKHNYNNNNNGLGFATTKTNLLKAVRQQTTAANWRVWETLQHKVICWYQVPSATDYQIPIPNKHINK